MSYSFDLPTAKSRKTDQPADSTATAKSKGAPKRGGAPSKQPPKTAKSFTNTKTTTAPTLNEAPTQKGDEPSKKLLKSKRPSTDSSPDTKTTAPKSKGVPQQKGSEKSQQATKKEDSAPSKKSQKGIDLSKFVRSSTNPSDVVDTEEPVDQTSESNNLNMANAESSASGFGAKSAVIVSMIVVVGGALIAAY